MSLTKATYSMITGAPVNILDYGADLTGVADSTSAIQMAVNAGKKVYFPAGTYKVTATINLVEGSFIFGDGIGVTVINSTATGFTFEKLNANGTEEIQAPKFFDFTLITTNSGIRLNSQSGGFTDNASSQAYMMRPVIERCSIEVSATGTGLQFSKVFDGYVANNKIMYGNYALDFVGCDLNMVNNNRLIGQTIATIRDQAANTFGSQNYYLHNDMLALLAGGTAFVISDNRDITIQNNYFETGNAISTAFRISGGYYLNLSNNRVEAQSGICPNWIISSADMINVYIANNKNSGGLLGSASFNSGNGIRYWYNNTLRQQIFHYNNNTEIGIPFNTVPDDAVQTPLQKVALTYTPSVTGLLNSNYGASVLVRQNAFVLPALASFGSLITFYNADLSTTGTVNIYIKAYASVNGQIVNVQRLNTTTPIATVTQALTTSSAVYKVFSAVSVTDVQISIWNNDTTNNGNAYIQQVIVEYN
jgi:hypothetical protein